MSDYPSLADVVRAHRLVIATEHLDPFTPKYRCELGCCMFDAENVNTAHAEHVQAEWETTRLITTAEQLAALPSLSVVQSLTSPAGQPWIWELFDEGWYTTALDPGGLPDLPAILVYVPEAEVD